ncbi:CHAT domain-containing tetratricopeptide repeat protein [Sorangium sp. So ce1389]|uniref:CHAT domain-containing tetratricopeptide repeat protein n=1 Tax=Sorangium sp. So ce1389 TaxID=3133336 RepID=UPI003F609CBA
MATTRWTPWLCGALAALCAAVVAPAPVKAQIAQPHWVPQQRTELPSPEDERLNFELEVQVSELTTEGRYFEALSSAERLLELRQRVLGPEHVETLFAATWAAMHHRRVAQYHQAASLLERVLAVLERDGVPDWWLFGEQDTLARVYREMGDFRRAEAFYRRLLAQEVLAGSGADKVLLGLAELAKAQGDLGRAASLYERLLATQEKENATNRSRGEQRDAIRLGVALDNLAEVYRLQGSHTRAEALFQRAVSIMEQWRLGAERSLATCLDHQALLYQDMGDDARAEPLFQRALAIREKELRPTHPDIAEPLVHLGALYWDRKQYGRAQASFRRALSLLQQALGPEHPRVAECARSLEGLAIAQGKLREALPMRLAAVSAEDRHLTRLLTSGAEREKLAFLGRLERSTSETISLHAISAPKNGEAAALALTTILRRKARALDAMAGSLASLRRSMTRQDQALLDRLGEIDAELSARAYRDPPGQRARVQALVEEREGVEAEVSRRSAAFRAEQRPVLLAEVQAAIPDDAALIELFAYRPYQPRARQRDWLGEPRYVAYVLRRKGAPAFADLGEVKAIDAAVEELRRALSDPSREPTRLARGMDAQLMAKVRPLLGPARKLLISPDGALSLLPFGALIDEDQRSLLERYEITYITTGRDLLRLTAPAEPGQELVVIADPAFDGGASAPPVGKEPCSWDCQAPRGVDLSRLRFLSLPGTAKEAAAVGAKLTGARVLTGASATEGAVKGLARPRILHIATHGFFLPAASAPAQTPARYGLDAVARAAVAASVSAVDSALLRSGLAFAGANLRESGGDDGVLTAAEVSGLDLSGTQLVVLSACDTGVGEPSHGEGVQGLRRALVIAGAETQVMSLWRIGDQATRHLMTAYYDRLVSGRARSDALREAQLSLKGQPDTAHPYYWAAFIVSGNGGPLRGGPLLSAVPKPQTDPVEPVRPGPRGCACEVQGGAAGGAPRLDLAAGLAAGLAAAARRRRAGSTAARRSAKAG